ncbi:PfkB family carbohydrate kinase, partial [Amycolatopsis vancoresmycina]
DRDGERTVVSRNAAGSQASWSGSVDADVVLVDGHHPNLALSVARAAGDVPVVLDAGSWKPVLDELLPLVDIAACSAHFAAPEPGLHQRGVPTVITTAGPRPVRWSTADGGSGEVPVPAVEARDTLGAGDVWHGALAVAVVREPTVPDRIRFANEVAAERVRHVGPRSWTTAIAGRNTT